MKTRLRKRPPKTSGWYKFSLSGKKMYSDTRAIDYSENEEVIDKGRKPYVTKYVNGVYID